MELSFAEISMFPIPYFELKYLKKYKENLIFIPTQRNSDGTDKIEKIPCLFKENKNSNNILLIFHCNGTDIFNTFHVIHELSEEYNINIFLPEYPGYSIYKPSIPSSEKCLDNSIIIYDYLLKNIKNITEKNIYILGRSLGTGPAVYLSSKRNPAGTILISPFTTFAAVGKRDEEDTKILLNHFRSIDYIDKINTPLLFIHGKIDPLIDYKESITLYEKSRKDVNKEIKIVDNMTHFFFLDDLVKDILPLIFEFVDKYCPLNKNLNKIEINFDKNIYLSKEELKQSIFVRTGKEEIEDN